MPKSKRVESSDDESEGKTVSPTHSDKSRSRRRTQASREEETIPPLDEDDTGAISLLEKFTGRPRRRGGDIAVEVRQGTSSSSFSSSSQATETTSL